MEIEELPPHKSNFRFVVWLFAGSIVVILLLAIAYVKHTSHMGPGGKAPQGSSFNARPVPANKQGRAEARPALHV